MTNADSIEQTAEWFRRAVPEPHQKNFSTQLGVHFEEVREMIVELTPLNLEMNSILLDAGVALQKLADHLKANADHVVVTPENRKKYLDAICDQIVTGTGCAHMLGMDIAGAMRVVNASNFDKFDSNGNPIFNPQTLKIMKRPGWEAPDLTAFA